MNPFISLVLFFWLWAGGALAAGAEFAVPNGGSPYRNLAQLPDETLVHLPTGMEVSVEQMLDAVTPSRVIYIGETHDNLEAHRVQLEIIRRLNTRKPGRVAIGMEMFRRSAQPELDAWHRGALSGPDFRRLFRRNWGVGYRAYTPITDFAQQNKIPVIGLKSSLEMEQNFREHGPDQPGLPKIDFDDPYHKAYAMALFGANEDHAPEVQRPYHMLLLWEETMAETVARFVTDPARRDWTLVVLAGGFHVQYGFGIPKRAYRRVPHAYSIILPTVTEIPEALKEGREMNLNPVSIPLYSADYAWKLAYKVAEDNGLRLGVMLEEQDGGLLVKSVSDGSNAASMALEKDDVILAMDGQAIGSIDDLRDHLQAKTAGDPVSVRVRRGGGELTLTGTLEKTKHP